MPLNSSLISKLSLKLTCVCVCVFVCVFVCVWVGVCVCVCVCVCVFSFDIPLFIFTICVISKVEVNVFLIYFVACVSYFGTKSFDRTILCFIIYLDLLVYFVLLLLHIIFLVTLKLVHRKRDEFI
jgi:hypothetical protein